MCNGCKVIEERKYIVDDDFCIKLDCFEQILYKTHSLELKKYFNSIFLDDINLYYNTESFNIDKICSLNYEQIFYIKEYIINKEYLINIEKFLDEGNIIALKTRIDLLPMYGCFYKNDNKTIYNEEKVIELFNNSEMEYDMLKKMIIKNNTSLERTNKNFKNIEYKMIKIISNILKFDDDIISFLKTIAINNFFTLS